MSEQKDYMALGKELKAKILNVISEYQEVLGAIAEAKKSKVAAKKSYGECFDRGDERGMSICLLRIREANQKIETGPDSRSEYFAKIEGLEEEYKAVQRISREHIQEAEARKNQAEKNWRKAQENENWISGIRVDLNSLQKIIVESGEVKSISEDQEI